MKRLLVLSLMLLFSASLASGASLFKSFSNLPVIADSSTHPDSFGYTWVDNDGGGSPVYNWIDITGIGTQVTGLTDDNNVGPFALGFDFPYYWYSVDSLHVGSNGYISFSSAQNFADPFGLIPSDTIPPDLVCPLGGDLDFTRGNGSCYYYTNHADSFIISWINVGEFAHIDSTHTFQLILCKNDSSLTFQYNVNHGNFESQGNHHDCIGIANSTRRVGLSYLRNNVPSNHLWHSGLAIRWHAIPNPNFVAHDIGVLEGLNGTSGADFVANNSQYIIHAFIKNYGTETETDCKAIVKVQRGSTTLVTDTVIIATLAPSEVVEVTFARPFAPTVAGVHKATFNTSMTVDSNPTNNQLICELDVYTLPQDLSYTSNTPSGNVQWIGDFAGFGNEFVVPEAITLTSASFYCFSVDAAGPCVMWVIGADSLGHPDFNQSLERDSITVNLNDAGWITVPLNDINIAANQKFFVMSIAVFDSTFSFGMDAIVPHSNRGYEYTGGLNPDRSRYLQDVAIKVHAEAATGIGDMVAPKFFSLSQNYPNPFNAHTNISFSLARASDVDINIYNIVGQVVNTISGHYSAGKNTVTWDASGVASGVYFYRINVGNMTETRKMVLLK